MKIAVVSDIHVGKGARAKDLCPSNVKSSAAETGFKDRFLTFLREKVIVCDYLVLPGDVSHIAQPSEFQLASEFISEIALTLRVDSSRIIFVPGNHDVDWSVLQSNDTTGFRQTQRYAPLAHSKWIFEEIMRRAKSYVLLAPYFCSWDFSDLVVVGYNSSWGDSPEEAVHHGGIATDHLTKLDHHLSAMDLSPTRIRLFLVHHHPVLYSDPVDDPPDFSAMTNAGNLLATLRKYQFDFLIHGHKHMPNFETQIVDSGSPLAILCSGSLSVQLDTRWSGLVNNQFHVVNIEGRDSSNNVYGHVESWTYVCGDGWVPSRPHNGIRHQDPFGTYLQPEELKKTLRAVLAEELAHKRYVEWKDVVSSASHLKYLPPERTVEVLDHLSGELGFKRHGELPDHLVLLKK